VLTIQSPSAWSDLPDVTTWRVLHGDSFDSIGLPIWCRSHACIDWCTCHVPHTLTRVMWSILILVGISLGWRMESWHKHSQSSVHHSISPRSIWTISKWPNSFQHMCNALRHKHKRSQNYTALSVASPPCIICSHLISLAVAYVFAVRQRRHALSHHNRYCYVPASNSKSVGQFIEAIGMEKLVKH